MTTSLLSQLYDNITCFPSGSAIKSFMSEFKYKKLDAKKGLKSQKRIVCNYAFLPAFLEDTKSSYDRIVCTRNKSVLYGTSKNDSQDGEKLLHVVKCGKKGIVKSMEFEEIAECVQVKNRLF